MKTFEVSRDLKVAYEEAGEGIPLVFLHAFPLTNAMWKAQVEEFSSNFHVLAPNARGIGQSSSFRCQPSLQTLASDLAEWLEEMGIYDAVILCGLSMGGYTALEFARTYPEKLRGLILADTRADADSADGRKARNEMIAFAAENTGKAVAQKMLPKLLGATSQKSSPRLAGKVTDIALPNSGKNLSQLVAAMRDRRDSTESLSGIVCPTLVVGGSEDVVSPPQVMADMANRIPNARHTIIEGVGHLANLENPEAFNRALREFLNHVT
ncbi:alpha/beta fold hydrolase [bacterium]|nr:MAG: alpha/beta fold hydrolase [bacterium]